MTLHTSNRILTILSWLTLASVLVLGVFAYQSATVIAQTNPQINYQGKLTDTNGSAVPDGTYNMRFWLLQSTSQATTSAIWTEELTGSNRVQVTNGLFSVMLGSTSALTSVDFNQTLYLGVEIGSTTATAQWDGEMSPRKILGSVPAAFEARQLGGVASTSFLRSDQADTASALLSFSAGFLSQSSSTISELHTGTTTVTYLTIDGETFTDITGTGLQNTNGALSVSSSSLNVSLAGLVDTNLVGVGTSDILSYNGTSWVNQSTSTFLMESELSTEGELETLLGGLDVLTVTTDDITSANLATLLSDETGTGNVVFSTNPLLTGFRSTASSTIQSLTFATATGTTLVLGADRVTDLTGTGLTISNNALTVSSSSLNISLAGLIDTDTTGIASGTILVSDGTSWYARATSTLGLGGAATLAGLSDVDTAGASAGNILTLNSAGNWVDTSTSTFLLESELNTETELEALLGDVTNVFTNNDGALADDDISDDSLETLSDVAAMTQATGDLLYWNGSAWSNIATNTLNIALSDTTGTLGVTRGGTGLTTVTAGDLLYADGSNSIASLSAGTEGQILSITGGSPTWSATSSLGLGNGTFLGLSDVSVGSYVTDRIFFSDGSGVVDSANFTFDSTSDTLTVGGLTMADGLFSFTSTSTFLIPNNATSAFSFATSTNAPSLFSIDTTAGNTSVNVGSGSGDVYIGGIGSASNLVFEESSTISGQGTNVLTLGESGDQFYLPGTVYFSVGTTSTTSNGMLLDGGLTLGSSSPSVTSNTLYNLGGTLYFNGSAVASDDAATLSGLASTSFLRSDQDDTATGLLTFSGGFTSQASSTIQSLSIGTATTTNLVINGERFTDLTGTGLTISNNALTVSSSSLNISLAGLIDTDTTGIASGTILVSDGTNWYARATSTLGLGVSDGSVSSSSLSISNWQNGYVLQASTTAAGGFDWVSTTTLGITGGASTLAGLSDVTTTNVVTGNLLQYTGSGWATTSTSTLNIDAITLDSLDSTQFLRSDIADTATGLLTFSGGFTSQASSTIQSLTFGTATGTTLVIGGDTITEFAGTGLSVVGGTLNVGALTTSEITDGTLTEADLNLNAPTDGYVLQASSTAAGGFVWVATSSLNYAESLFTDGGATTYLTTTGDNLAIGTSTSNSKLSVWGDLRVGTSSTPSLFVDTSTDGVAIGTATTSMRVGATRLAAQLTVAGSLNNQYSTEYPPIRVASTSLGSSVDYIQASGDYLIAVEYVDSELSVIDITDPDGPVVIATTSTGVNPNYLDTAGHYAYVSASGPGALQIFDFSDPTNPRMVGEVTLGNDTRQVKVSGRYAFVGNNATPNIAVVDVGDPTNPRHVATVSGIGGVINLFVQGQYLYGVDQSGNDLEIVDISDPLNPVKVLSDFDVEASGLIGAVYASGRYVYVGASDVLATGGLHVYDVIDPANPVEVAHYQPGTIDLGLNSNFFVANNTLYAVSDADDSLYVFDITDPTDPRLIHTVATGDAPRSIHVAGQYIYVSNYLDESINIFKNQGITTPTLAAGLGYFEDLTVNANANIRNRLQVGYSMNVGDGGILTSGSLAVSGTTSASYFAGYLGLGSTTPISLLTMDARGLTTEEVAGIEQYFTFANSVEDAVKYGNRSYLVATNTATTTLVGTMLRIEDSTSFGNTVRGFEVQADKGVNTLGENTALSGFARTFGVRGTTRGDAGGSFEPAGGFFETEGTTQGNAIRGFSDTITTSELLQLFQTNSEFTGTGLLMNFGNGGGSFPATSTSAKFVDFQSAGTSMFTVSARGTTTIGDGTQNNAAGLAIGYGGLCVDNDGSCTPVVGRVAYVSNFTGNSDLAENYFSDQLLEPGEVVRLRSGLSVERATSSESGRVIGVVSTKPGVLLGSDDESLVEGETAYPIALSGRVPIKLSTENGPITAGDPIMLSSIPGVGMKASGTATIVGYALEDFSGEFAYTEGFVNQFGDDIAEPQFEPLNVNEEALARGSCYYGGGEAMGTASSSATSTPVICEGAKYTDYQDEVREENARREAEALQRELERLAKQDAAEVELENGEVVRVGQALLFVQLAEILDRSTEDAFFAELMSTSTVPGETGESWWERIKNLAGKFVDGVLTIAGLKADKVETQELCVDGTCIDGAGLRALLQAANNDGQVVEVVTQPAETESHEQDETTTGALNPPTELSDEPSDVSTSSSATTTPATSEPEVTGTSTSDTTTTTTTTPAGAETEVAQNTPSSTEENGQESSDVASSAGSGDTQTGPTPVAEEPADTDVETEDSAVVEAEAGGSSAEPTPVDVPEGEPVEPTAEPEIDQDAAVESSV